MLFPSFIIDPHSGIGSGELNPKNDNPASSIIIIPTSADAVITSAPIILGIICFKIIFRFPFPLNFAANIKVSLFIAITSHLASLEYLGHEIRPIAIIAFLSPPPRIPATATAIIIPGKDRKTSTIPMIISSTIPP
jgi:hypothetical protein